MKRILLSTALAVLPATVALAGALVEPMVDPAPMLVAPAPMAPFEGFYGGLTGGLAMGEAITDPGTIFEATFPLDGLTYGGFAGYNFQSGNVVYGVDLMAQMGDLTIGGFDFDLDYLVDARVRVGYAMGDAMAYVAGGYSMAQATLSGVPGATGDADGWNVGAGVEFNATDNVFIGAEYIYRDLSGNYGATPVDVRLDTIQLRVGMRF